MLFISLVLSNISKNILNNIPYLSCPVPTFVQIFNPFFLILRRYLQCRVYLWVHAARRFSSDRLEGGRNRALCPCSPNRKPVRSNRLWIVLTFWFFLVKQKEQEIFLFFLYFFSSSRKKVTKKCRRCGYFTKQSCLSPKIINSSL